MLSLKFHWGEGSRFNHYNDVIMGVIASQITSLTIVCSKVYSGADQRKHDSSGSLAFVQGIHRGPVNSPHKWPVTRRMFPFHVDVMTTVYGVNRGLRSSMLLIDARLVPKMPHVCLLKCIYRKEWSWRSADRRYSNYIWVINNLIAY